MSESKDYKNLINNWPNKLDRIDRVENYVVDGMPDINMCIDGCEVWIEQKSPKEPARSTTPLFGSNHKVLQTQKNWFLRHTKSGGSCYFLIVSDKRWMLIPGFLFDEINEMTVDELLEQSVWTTTKPIRDKNQWKYLRQTLQRQTALKNLKQNHTNTSFDV